jgi:hypothetical protein
MAEPNLAVIVLKKKDFHPENVYLMHLLEVKPDLVAGLQAIELWTIHHELVIFILRVTCSSATPKLLIVELYNSIIGIFDKTRNRSYYVILPVTLIVFGAGMLAFWLCPTLLGMILKTGRIKGKEKLLAKATQIIDLQSSLHVVDGLPVTVTGRLLKLIDEFQF